MGYGVLCCLAFFHPALALHDAGDQHAGNGIAAGVDHGGRGVHQEADHGDNGEGFGGEAVKADDEHLADEAAARDTAHGHAGKHSHADGGKIGADAGELHVEDAEQEGDLQNGGKHGTVHMHGGADGHHDLAHIPFDADFFAGFQVNGDGGDGAAGGKGRESGSGDVGEHAPYAQLAACKIGVQGEHDEQVQETNGIVNDHGPGIVSQELGSELAHQAGEIGGQADGGIIHDDLHQLHHDIVQVSDDLTHGAILAAAHTQADAEEDGENDQGQHIIPGKEAGEIVDGNAVYNGVRQNHLFKAAIPRHIQGNILGRGPNIHHGDDNDAGDDAGDHKHQQHIAQDLTQAFQVHHGAHGSDHAGEHQGHHHGEHQVQEYLAKGFKDRGLLPHSPAQQAANNNGADEQQREAVAFPEGCFFGFHSFYAPLQMMMIMAHPLATGGRVNGMLLYFITPL